MESASLPFWTYSDSMPIRRSIIPACSQAVISSSTMRARRAAGSKEYFPVSVPPHIPSGMQTVKVDPLPFSESTSILPPIISVIFLEMASPRPVLPGRITSPSVPFAKGSKSSGRCSGAMPLPLSEITKQIFTLPSVRDPSFTVKEILPPEGVYWTAFSRILKSTCFSFRSSPI